MKRATLAALLALATAALAAEGLPDAPSVTQPPATKHTATWSRQLVIATTVHGGIRVLDDVRSCQHLANGGHEYGFPTQSCAGVIGFNTAVFAGLTFASYELAKHGHHKLAVALQYAGAAYDTGAIVIPRHDPVTTVKP